MTDPARIIESMILSPAEAFRRARQRQVAERIRELRRTVPELPDAGGDASTGDVLSWMLAHPDAGDLVWEYIMRTRRADVAPLLLEAARSGLFPRAQLARVLRMIWTDAVGFRETEMPPGRWVELCRHVGYIDGGQLAEPPDEPLTLYRGCVPAAIDPETGVGFRRDWGL